MKPILRHGRVLRALAAERLLVALDFDGTLAPIVAVPDDAQMRGETRQLLQRLAQRYPCIVISGRTLPDLRHRVAGLPLRSVIGHHGGSGIASARVRRMIAAWRAYLEIRVAGLAGVQIEDKVTGLAVHYRRAEDRPRARRVIVRAVANLAGARSLHGKMVVDVMPAHAATKAEALLSQWRRLRCTAALYVGDDATDEDVFSLARGHRLVSIRIGRSTRSRARYYLGRQREVDRLLALLLAASRQ